MLDYEFFYIMSIPIYIFLIMFLMFKKVNKNKIMMGSFFHFYVMALMAVTIFPIPMQWLKEIWMYMWWNSNNFMPFVSILDMLLNNNLDIFMKMKQVMGNMVIFIPMGFLMPLIWKSKNSLSSALFIGFGATVSIEVFQYVISFMLWFNYKVTDIDDIMLNTLGFVMWFFLYKMFKKSLVNK